MEHVSNLNNMESEPCGCVVEQDLDETLPSNGSSVHSSQEVPVAHDDGVREKVASAESVSDNVSPNTVVKPGEANVIEHDFYSARPTTIKQEPIVNSVLKVGGTVAIETIRKQEYLSEPTSKQTPGQASEQVSENKCEQKFEQKAEQKSEQKAAQKSGQKAEQKDDQIAEQKAEHKAEKKSEQKSEEGDMHSRVYEQDHKKLLERELVAREVLNSQLLDVISELRRANAFIALHQPLLIVRNRKGDYPRKRRRVFPLVCAVELGVDLETDTGGGICIDTINAKCDAGVYTRTRDFIDDFEKLRNETERALCTQRYTAQAPAVQHARLALEVVEEEVARGIATFIEAERALACVMSTPPERACVLVGADVDVFWVLDLLWHRCRVEELCANTYARVIHENLEMEWIDLRDETCWRPAKD